MKKSTFLRASLVALLLGGTGSLGTQAQDLPTLSTDNETHYYLIQNNRTGKYADKDFNQTTTVSTATMWTFTASDETFENGCAAKIHNMGIEDASANALNGFNHTYTADGITWYVQAEGSTFSISSSTDGLDTDSGNNGGNSWNDYQGAGKTISNWGHSDTGSQWNIVEATDDQLTTAFTEVFNEKKTQAETYLDAVGEYAGEVFYPTTDAVEALREALTAAGNFTPTTAESVITAYKALTSAIAVYETSSIILPTEGKYYIVNKQHSRYITSTTEGIFANESADPEASVWTLNSLGDNKYSLSNDKGEYIGVYPQANNTAFPTASSADAAGTFTFPVGKIPGYVCISSVIDGTNPTNGFLHDASDAYHRVVGWTNNSSSNASYWTFEAVEYPYESTINDYINDVEARASYVGGITTTDEGYVAAKATALETPTKANYEALVAAVNNAQKVAFDPAKLYRIQNYARKSSTLNTNNPGQGGYMEVTDKNITSFTIDMAAIDVDNSRATAIWKFEPKTDGATTYKLHNLNSDLYVGPSKGSGNHINAVAAESAADVTLTDVNDAQWNIFPNADISLHASGNTAAIAAGVMCYGTGANGPSAWYIIPATTIDLNVGAAGYATVNYPFAVELPAGVTAYKVGSEDDAAVTLAELKLTGNVLPANTPVIVTAAEGKYTLTLLPDNTDEAIETGLGGTTVSAYHDAYILSKQEGDEDVKFYRLADNSFVYPNKAYLNATATTESLALKIGGTTTGITGATATDGAETYYDLNGRRVLYPAKGIFVTESGKKVILK